MITGVRGAEVVIGWKLLESTFLVLSLKASFFWSKPCGYADILHRREFKFYKHWRFSPFWTCIGHLRQVASRCVIIYYLIIRCILLLESNNDKNRNNNFVSYSLFQSPTILFFYSSHLNKSQFVSSSGWDFRQSVLWYYISLLYIGFVIWCKPKITLHHNFDINPKPIYYSIVKNLLVFFYCKS